MQKLIAYSVLTICMLFSANMDAQKSFNVESTIVNAKDKNLTYVVQIDDKYRRVTYSSPEKNHLKVVIKNKKGKTITTVKATKELAKVKMGRATFTVKAGQKVKWPERVDVYSIWLLENNLFTNPSIGADHLISILGQENGEFSNGEPLKSIGPGTIAGILGGIIDIWDWWNNDDDNCVEDVNTCIYTDLNGNAHEVMHICNCGESMCNIIPVTTTVMVAVTDSGTGETRLEEEVRSHTVCNCYCVETNFGKKFKLPK